MSGGAEWHHCHWHAGGKTACRRRRTGSEVSDNCRGFQLVVLFLGAGACTAALLLSTVVAGPHRATPLPPRPLCYADTYSGPSSFITVPCTGHEPRVYQNVTYNWTLQDLVQWEQLEKDVFGPRQNVSSISLTIDDGHGGKLALYDNRARTNSITHHIQWVEMRDLAVAKSRSYYFKFDLFNPYFNAHLYSYPGSTAQRIVQTGSRTGPTGTAGSRPPDARGDADDRRLWFA